MTRCLLAVIALFWAAQSWAGVVEGRVVHDDEPVAGIEVKAYHSLDFSREPFKVSGPTDAAGSYRLELPDGRYALFAFDPQRQLFAFCGRNPVGVGGAPVWAGLQAVGVTEPAIGPYDAEYSGAIEGRVMYAGRPLAGAYVYLYTGVEDDLKGQGYRMSAPTDADGFFAFDDLVASRYFLSARKRQDGSRVGPVLAGDYLGVFPGNPVHLRAGQTLQIELETVRKVKSERESETFASTDGPLLRGVVVDVSGQPVAGMHVFAYTERVIGHKRPVALSAPTAGDGQFELMLPNSGLYYVGARQYYGDSPAPGELFGMYEESADHGLRVDLKQPGEKLRIVVEAVTLN